MRAWDYNVFAQDDWKVSPEPDLQSRCALRARHTAVRTRGQAGNLIRDSIRPRLLSAAWGVPIGPPVGGFVQAGNVDLVVEPRRISQGDKSVVKSDDPNNSARASASPTCCSSGKLVVRGGYGINYYFADLVPVHYPERDRAAYVCLWRASRRARVESLLRRPGATQFPTLVPGVALSGTLFDRNLKTPLAQQYNLGVQYQFSNDLLLEVGYVGSRGQNLFRQVAINQARLASPQNPITNDVTGAVITTNTAANAALRAPYSGVGINNFFQNQSTAQSTYHSLQASLTKRFSHGLQFLASYTFAKSIDNASGQGGGAGVPAS